MAVSGSTIRAFTVRMRDGAPTAIGAVMNVHPSVAYSDRGNERRGTLDDAIEALRLGQSVTIDAGNMQFVELCRRMDRDVLKQECHQ